METAVDHVRKRLRLLANLLNNNENTKSNLIAWIDKYDGKIIEFQVDNSAFHVIFTKENVAFKEGSYPSADAIIVIEPKFLMDLLSGKIRLSTSLVTEGKFRVWGNFHELVSFSRVISSL